MNDRKANLIAKYLAGEVDADEVQQLNHLLVNDPQSAHELMSEAYLDIHLRERLTGSALGAVVDEKVCPSKTVTKRFSSRWMVAAMLLVAVSGWAVASYFAGELRNARTSIDALNSRVAKLGATKTSKEAPATRAPARASNGEAPKIQRVRGLLMTAQRKENASTETELLKVGTTAPLNQRLWTCPWGATEFRYNAGASISVERNTTIELNETKGKRQLTLGRGIVHITNLSKTDKRPTEIKCPLATVHMTVGQVAVQVDEQQTSVEAAIHLVKVHVNGVKRSFTLRRGQYLIVKPGETPKVMQGMLKLGLNPPNT